MSALLLAILAALGSLALLAGLVALVAKKMGLFRTEKATTQMAAIPESAVTASRSGQTGSGAAGRAPRLRETSVAAWAARLIDLKATTVTIGRSLDSDIVLVEDAVSVEHCRLEWENDSVRLVDLGSTNKTWVNGHKIHNVVLRDGDQIRVGHTTFVFEAAVPRDGPPRRRLSA